MFRLWLLATLCFGALVVLEVKSEPNNSPVFEQWEGFKYTFNKKYTDPEEEESRRNVFEKNVAEVREHNRKFAAGHVTWEKTVDEFSDLTEEEFLQLMTPQPTTFSTRQANCVPVANSVDSADVSFVPNPNVTVPKEFDWREHGAVTPVSWQGCGTCYIFGTLPNLEAQLFFKTGKLRKLSAQNIVDCGINAPISCKGGSSCNVLRYVERKGLMLEKDYPYEAKDGKCRFDPKKSVMKLKGRGIVRKEEHLAEAIFTKGPIAISVQTKNFSGYKKGVIAPYGDCEVPGHVVSLVGYGTLNGTDFYLAKNSWGSSWGDNGYIRIPRNVNFCHIVDAAYYGIWED